MNREFVEIEELALANILDVIPLISNTGERVDPIIEFIRFPIFEFMSATLQFLSKTRLEEKRIYDILYMISYQLLLCYIGYETYSLLDAVK